MVILDRSGRAICDESVRPASVPFWSRLLRFVWPNLGDSR
jgi:hypothetical protein